MSKSFVLDLEPVLNWLEVAGHDHPRSSDLYSKLVEEEFYELTDSMTKEEELDAICDLIWVLVGLAVSNGYDLQGAFNAVVDSNMTKMVNGRFIYDQDGKIRKPVHFIKPNLSEFV